MSFGPSVDPRLGPGHGVRPVVSRAPILTWSAFVCVISVGVVVVVARYLLYTRHGQDLDQDAMDTVYAREHTVERVLSILGYISTGTAAVAMTVCVALALARKRFAAAAAAVIVVAGANISTQVLKHSVLDRPDYGHLVVNSLPSGHTTVVTSLVLAALLVAGAGVRAFVVVLGSFAVTFTGASTLVAGWHRPGDVIVALALCLAWGAAAVFVLGMRRPGTFTGAPWTQTAASFAGAIAAGVMLVLIGVRPDQGWSGFLDAAWVLGLLGVASAGTVGVFARLSSVHAI